MDYSAMIKKDAVSIYHLPKRVKHYQLDFEIKLRFTNSQVCIITGETEMNKLNKHLRFIQNGNHSLHFCVYTTSNAVINTIY